MESVMRDSVSGNALLDFKPCGNKSMALSW